VGRRFLKKSALATPNHQAGTNNEKEIAVKGLGYIKTPWGFEERPVASAKLNTWDTRIEAAFELVFFLLSQAWGGGSGVVRAATAKDLKVEARLVPGFSVEVEPGYAMISGYPFKLAARTETTEVAAPLSNPRMDLVVAELATGAPRIITGTEASTPTAPATPADTVALARLYLRPGMNYIRNTDDAVNGYIIDVRTFV
jgi:hypothetical protein